MGGKWGLRHIIRPMSAPARYDDVTDFYVSEIGNGIDDPATQGLLSLSGDVAGLRLLDLACGHGRVSRELASRGARVTGVDLAPAMIALARSTSPDSAPPDAGAAEAQIEYLVADVCDPAAFGSGAFDGVVSGFGMSDIDDLDAVLRTVRQVLVGGGFFAMSILHPCFPGRPPNVSSSWPPGDGYFTEGWWRSEAPESKLRQVVGANHRTVSTYLNAMVRHGLAIDAISEPQPPDSWAAATPRRGPVPMFFAVRCTKRD